MTNLTEAPVSLLSDARLQIHPCLRRALFEDNPPKSCQKRSLETINRSTPLINLS